ncbi:MAG: tRNA-dihydrouridine synthase family protein [Candidatus Micrarchaeota archaeon]|nr:tRNA-dihydrouridine synthase family protein [Candidatus Micrarchaeota archaeon]
MNNVKIAHVSEHIADIVEFQLMLAPMEGVTDGAFRALCHKNGADLTFTGIARVGNLARSKKGELEKISIPDSTPTQIQLAGARISDYEKFLAGFQPTGGFRGFNLNLGCPSPDFLRQGIGAAMIKRVSRVNEIVSLIGRHGYDCSVKLRLGVDAYEKEKGAYLNLIKGADASFFVVHAKTAMQASDEPADFSVYGKCVDTGKKIVANGDIKTKEQVASLRRLGLYGAMIGRAAMENPKIFRELALE